MNNQTASLALGENIECERLCIIIIYRISRLSKSDFEQRLKTGVTLGDLTISDARADGDLRVTINRLIRSPSDRPPFPRGTFSAGAKVADVVRQSCN